MGTTRQSRKWSAALIALYETHYMSLVRCGQRLLDSEELAEEAVQEAFVRYHDRGAKPAPGKELAYLRASVRNNACSMMRRRQLAEKHQVSYSSEPSWDIDDAIIQRDEGTHVRAALSQLSLRQREVLELRYWHNLSEQQMADHMKMSAGSVKTHSSRARARLRQELSHLAA